MNEDDVIQDLRQKASMAYGHCLRNKSSCADYFLGYLTGIKWRKQEGNHPKTEFTMGFQDGEGDLEILMDRTPN